MSLETDTNAKDTDKIGMSMLYQAQITDYVKIINEFNKNLRKLYTVIWEFCNNQIQNSIDTNVDYEVKIQDNPIKMLKSIKILM